MFLFSSFYIFLYFSSYFCIFFIFSWFSYFFISFDLIIERYLWWKWNSGMTAIFQHFKDVIPLSSGFSHFCWGISYNFSFFLDTTKIFWISLFFSTWTMMCAIHIPSRPHLVFWTFLWFVISYPILIMGICQLFTLLVTPVIHKLGHLIMSHNFWMIFWFLLICLFHFCIISIYLFSNLEFFSSATASVF